MDIRLCLLYTHNIRCRGSVVSIPSSLQGDSCGVQIPAKAIDLSLFQTVHKFSVAYPAFSAVKSGIPSGHLKGIKLPILILYKHTESPS